MGKDVCRLVLMYDPIGSEWFRIMDFRVENQTPLATNLLTCVPSFDIAYLPCDFPEPSPRHSVGSFTIRIFVIRPIEEIPNFII